MIQREFEKVLIGATGFVGSALAKQVRFTAELHRPNIAEIDNQRCGMVVCAGAPGAKWLANSQPEQDEAAISSLIRHLSSISADMFILISTVDVYPVPAGVDENTAIETDGLHPYGKNRLALEEFVRDRFERHLVIRLPGLYGAGLRKNFIFDMMATGHSEFAHHASRFQFYDVDTLWADVERALQVDCSLVNMATEPVSASEIASRAFDVTFTNETAQGPVTYDMRTQHASMFGREGPYLLNEEEVVEGIRNFVDSDRAGAR